MIAIGAAWRENPVGQVSQVLVLRPSIQCLSDSAGIYPDPHWNAPLKEPRGWWKYGWSMVDIGWFLSILCLFWSIGGTCLVVQILCFASQQACDQGWFVNVLSGEQSPISGMVGWHSRHSHGEDSLWLDDVESRQPWLIKTSGFVDLIQFD